MNNLIQKNIKFYTIDEIYTIVLENKIHTIPLKRFGIITKHKVMVSNILYKNYEIKIRPYRLFVEEKSFEKSRIIAATYIIEEVARRKQINNSNSTIKGFIRGLWNFFHWLNDNNIPFPDNINEAQSVFQQYVFTLKNYIKSKRYVQSECHHFFRMTSKLLKEVFNDKNGIISSGIIPITNKNRSSIQKPKDEEMIYVFKFYYQVFHQLTDFLLNEKQYPFEMILPDQKLWVIPSKHWFKREDTRYYLKSYNYETGQIKSVNDIKKEYGFKEEKTAYDYRNSFMYKLHENNIDTKSLARRFLGRVALKAYFMHFLAITGMNDSTAATLSWSDEYQIDKEQQNFKNIKYRANNKLVEFKIQKEFINDFKKFIKLREYLLDGHQYNYLFFSFDGKEATLSSKQTSGTYSSYINTEMRKSLDPNLPTITSKQYRVYKIYQMIKKDGLFAAASVAQNLTSTVVSNYITESDNSTMEQFNTYFEKFNKNLIFTQEEGSDINVGQCKKIDSPKEIVKNSYFDSDCTKYEGCLFCENYGIHADEIDIRKLYSLSFVINECKYISSSHKTFDKVYGPILFRIKIILDEIKQQVPEVKQLLKTIKIDVYENESLSPYFEHKLQTLQELGVLK